tara:strand:- start:860 stop:1084 length:225 start_codon:yes stop_codon:yes gene_type:complete
MFDKIILVSIMVSIFIYNRTLDYYKVLPRKNIFAAASVGIWTYVSFKYSIWFVIIGIVFLNILDKILCVANIQL